MSKIKKSFKVAKLKQKKKLKSRKIYFQPNLPRIPNWNSPKWEKKKNAVSAVNLVKMKFGTGADYAVIGWIKIAPLLQNLKILFAIFVNDFLRNLLFFVLENYIFWMYLVILLTRK